VIFHNFNVCYRGGSLEPRGGVHSDTQIQNIAGRNYPKELARARCIRTEYQLCLAGKSWSGLIRDEKVNVAVFSGIATWSLT